MISFPVTCLALVSLVSSLELPKLSERATGCGKTPSFTPGDFKNFTTSDGREYRAWLPASYDSNKATPLILSYHGANRDISRQVALDKLTHPRFNKDHIVVYLQGLAADGSTRTKWEGAPDCSSNDIKFTGEVLDAMTESLCVDEKRIYATGKSQGGGFVGRLACDSGLSSRIAAFAPVSGAYYIKEINKKSDCHPETVKVPCSPSRTNIPILAFHGGADRTIEYHGDFRSNACLPDVSSWARQWAQRDGLSGTPVNSTVADSENGVNMSYGKNGLVTLVYDGDNIGHDWPSKTRNADNSGVRLAAFDASARIMDFFRDHKLP
ncbi:carbohydrate esterase family 1 protein [Annulohypoxylon maeteangense]|uniref:carbohydrate esterase family 1 protein n=1 Tax=Annulohypoxylon maeteangense TaxID=1927788 RepID=UPI0020084DD3|nr:carbohydrate esterase family 1 protein [Annulohypoxylon maeteangense]KAI0880526.1 carbohydrate esterase family 1 protein [Annulohypoxylon maeteangense]